MMLKRLSFACLAIFVLSFAFALNASDVSEDAVQSEAASSEPAEADSSAADDVVSEEPVDSAAVAAEVVPERKSGTSSELRAITASAVAAGEASAAAAKEAEEKAAIEAARISNTPAAKAYAENRSETQGRNIVVPSQEAKSVAKAMAVARAGDTVTVKDGVYKETIHVAPGILLRAANPLKAVLDGRGRNTVVTMGSNSTISGFEIRNGAIGVFSAAGQASIKQCRIMKNIQSGIVCVGMLPTIEDNFIVYNKGSGIQGWDVRAASGSINHNTIAFNANHGIALGGNTSITVENNIIAFNDQFGVKPGEETVRVELINNNLYLNARLSSTLPSDNISDDPLFVDAKRMNFNLQKESRSIGQGTDSQNLGARILH